MKRSISIAAAVGLLCVAAARADAGLIGATVSSTYYFPNLGSLVDDDGTQKVAPTATFLVFGGVAIETITDTQIVVFDSTGFAFGTFNGPIFDFLGSGNLITGLTINSSSNMTGFTASNITLLSDGAGGQLVELNFQGLKTAATSHSTWRRLPLPGRRPPATHAYFDRPRTDERHPLWHHVRLQRTLHLASQAEIRSAI